MNSKDIIAIVNEGDRIPFDGKVIDGLAVVDESAETGVSTPALLDSTEGRNNAVAGTLVLEGWLKIHSSPNARMRKPSSQPDRDCGGQPARRATNSLLKVILILLVALVAAFLLAFATNALTVNRAISQAPETPSSLERVAQHWARPAG